jgi:hypothetical protein
MLPRTRTTSSSRRNRASGARRDYVWLAFWLKRRVDSPRFDKVDFYGCRDWGYRLRIRDEMQLDDELRIWLSESRTNGDQLPQVAVNSE